jgi:hypothetical protein
MLTHTIYVNSCNLAGSKIVVATFTHNFVTNLNYYSKKIWCYINPVNGILCETHKGTKHGIPSD